MAKIPSKYIKGLGIPYQGSKRDIAFSIVCAIHQRHPQAEYFYDLFGGGGAITAVAVQFGYKVIYNEYNTAVYNLFKRLCEKEPLPKEWYEWVSREKFKECLGKTDAYSAMVQCCWCYGSNKEKGYLYGVGIEQEKRLLFEAIYNNDANCLQKFNKLYNSNLSLLNCNNLNKRRLWIRQQSISGECRKAERKNDPLKRVYHMEKVELLQHNINCFAKMPSILYTLNLSYEQVPITTPKDKTVVYLDPPYRNTAGYTAGAFDNAKLDDWFRQLEYPCYMSEYGSPHECVFVVQKNSQLKHTKDKRKVAQEKLYWNGVA